MPQIRLAPAGAMIVAAVSSLVLTAEPSGAQGVSATCGPATPVPAMVSATPTGGLETPVRFGQTDALLWPAGEYGAVLVHGAIYDAASWRPQAEAIAAAGTTVLAVEQTSPDDILAAIAFLREACGISEVALIGASAGASTALAAAATEPAVIDQLIILSGSGDVSGLGEQPNLFVASEGEGIADSARRMTAEAPGTANEALILPGDAHAQAIFRGDQGDDLLQAILDRLDAYRADAE